MKDTNKHSFEEEFKKVFEEAEAIPSPVLWAEIDAHLANQEASRYKRRLLYYKISAAAAVVLLVSFIGLWSLNDDLSGGNGNVAIQQPNTGNASENGNGTRSTATDEALLRENAARANDGFENRNAEKSGLGRSTDQANQPSVSGTIQESLAIQSPNATAPTGSAKSPSELSEVASDQPGILSDAPASPSGQPTLAENTQVLPVRKSSGTQGQDVLTQNQNSDLSTGRKSANRGFEAAELTSSKNKTLPQKQTSGSDADLASKLPVKPADNEVTLTSRSSVVGTEQADWNKVLGNGKDLYSIDPLSRSIAVANTIYNLQAPAVQTKASPYPFWLEEEEEKEQKQKKSAGSKWSVALAFTPGQFDPNMRVNSSPVATANAKQAFSGYNTATNLSTGQTANSASPVSRDLQDAENFGLSYNVGMNVQYALSEKLSLQSGLQYMHNNSRIVTDNYLENFSNQERYPVFVNALGVTNQASVFIAENAALLDQNASPGIPNVNMQPINALRNTYPGVTQVSVQNLYQYISVPMRLQYKLIDKKLSTSIGAGVSADVFLKNTIGNTDAKVPEVEFTRQNNNIYKSIGISGLVSARVNYDFGSRYSVYVEPSYRTALSSFTRSDEIKSMPNSFGVGTGLQYRF